MRVQPAGAKKLSSKQKRKIGAAAKAAKGDEQRPQSVQDSIPYRVMYRDGLCHVTDRVFSRTVEFEDINYLLAAKDEQTATFERLCDFYNYFDSQVTIHRVGGSPLITIIL
jgi:hypothetical protein